MRRRSLPKESLSFFEILDAAVFVTVAIPVSRGLAPHYLREDGAAQVLAKIVSRGLLQSKSEYLEVERRGPRATSGIYIRGSAASVIRTPAVSFLSQFTKELRVSESREMLQSFNSGCRSRGHSRLQGSRANRGPRYSRCINMQGSREMVTEKQNACI